MVWNHQIKGDQRLRPEPDFITQEQVITEHRYITVFYYLHCHHISHQLQLGGILYMQSTLEPSMKGGVDQVSWEEKAGMCINTHEERNWSKQEPYLRVQDLED